MQDKQGARRSWGNMEEKKEEEEEEEVEGGSALLSTELAASNCRQPCQV